MTDVIEAMARAIERECHAADVATGGEGHTYDRVVRAALSAALERGWVMVPKEPTDPMIVSGTDVEIEREDCSHFVWSQEATAIYRTMLEKAPKP